MKCLFPDFTKAACSTQQVLFPAVWEILKSQYFLILYMPQSIMALRSHRPYGSYIERAVTTGYLLPFCLKLYGPIDIDHF